MFEFVIIQNGIFIVSLVTKEFKTDLNLVTGKGMQNSLSALYSQ